MWWKVLRFINYHFELDPRETFRVSVMELVQNGYADFDQSIIIFSHLYFTFIKFTFYTFIHLYELYNLYTSHFIPVSPGRVPDCYILLFPIFQVS